ncbi:MAG: outer membrane protein transport protein [Pseudomonadales bacterium]|nr:outer membrane protein transport protein [Pseudomonadales bacterium]
MKYPTMRGALPGALGCILISISSATWGAVVENLTLGNPKALALGNAVTADPPGIDSIHFNPAGLADLRGRQRQLKLLVASLNFKVAFGDHDERTQQVLDDFGYEDEASNATSETSTIGLKVPFSEGVSEWPLPFLVAPLGGASYSPPNSGVTFATSVYTPMAAGYIRDSDDPGRFMGEELSLMKITYFSPSIGIRLSDDWSVGASLGLSWQGAAAKTQLRVPNFALVLADTLVQQLRSQGACPDPSDPSPFIDLCGGQIGPYTTAASLAFDAEDALVWNLNIGALWKPTRWLSWGFVYQFESTADMEGSYELNYGDQWVNFFSDLHESDAWRFINALVPFPTGLRNSPDGQGIETGKATIEVKTPAHFATGISLQMTPNWKVNFDVKWTDWEVWEGLEVNFDKQLDFLKLATLVSPYAELQSLTIPRFYESVWNWALGLEYQYNDNLALRFGYEPRKTSVPDDKQDVLLPLGDAELYALGFEYRLAGNQIVEGAFGYLLAEADVPAGSSTNANSTDQSLNFIYNPYAGTDFSSQVQGLLFELSYTSYF